MDILKDGSVVLERLFARVLKHFAHVLCPMLATTLWALKHDLLTTAIGNMRHLATRHDVAFGILDYLGRCQRRRLGGSDRVHDADQILLYNVVMPLYMAR
jgi:hypothetical protein